MPGLTIYDTFSVPSQWESKKLPEISANLGRYSEEGGDIGPGEKILIK